MRILEGAQQEPSRNPVDLHRFHELDRHPPWIAASGDIELGDRFMEKGLTPVPVAETFETHAGEDRLARPFTLPDRLYRCSCAEREAAKIEIRQAKMGDQLMQIAGKYAARVSLGILRLVAEPVRTEVRHDYAKAGCCEPIGMAKLDPVGVAVAEQSVEQDDGPAHRPVRARQASPRPTQSKNGFARQPWPNRNLFYSGILPTAATHLSTRV